MKSFRPKGGLVLCWGVFVSVAMELQAKAGGTGWLEQQCLGCVGT